MNHAIQLSAMNLPPPGQDHEFHLGPFRVVWQHLRDGVSRGVERLVVGRGEDFVSVLPTRGMAVETVRLGGVRFGWDPPLDGPVHPNAVQLMDPSGLGWLDGFTELLCRCGLGNNGSPDFDPQGRLQAPLHGRIGNIPASAVSLYLDADGSLVIGGTVCEKRMHFWKWRMETTTRIATDLSAIEIEDRVTNDSGTAAGFQMLYHYNIGPPVLQAGSTVWVPVRKAVPREPHAGKDSEWNVARPPTPGRWESVWFAQPAFDPQNRSLAVLASPDRTMGTAIRFGADDGLNCLTLWKNEVAEADGYVFGLEPGTNWPNRRSFEMEHGRCTRLEAGQSARMRVTLEFATAQERVESWAGEVAGIQAGHSPEIVFAPDPGMCA